MLLIEGRLDSRWLRFPWHYAVALPEAALSGARCPAALWLHDLGENRHALAERVALGPLVDEAGAALILPDGRRSCFLNMARGPRWNDALAEELLPLLSRTLPIAGERFGAVGLGAGALGTLQLARRGVRCALIRPAYADPDGRDAGRWPVDGEWRGVFEGAQDQWRAGLWAQTRGLLMGDADRLDAAAERFGLAGWQRRPIDGDPRDRAAEALRYALGDD